MIVDDFNGVGAVGRPDETDATRPVDANTVLPAPILLERFKLIARRDPERVERHGGIELIERAARHVPYGAGTRPPCAARVDTIEHVLGAGISKRANHQRARTDDMPGA